MLKELQDRQSIRKFLPKQVEDEKIEELLRAAMQAPTARNKQTWRFLVITNREILDHMIAYQPYTGMMKQAPCAILVMGDVTTVENEGYLYLDGAAAIENILVEAVHQGLGACWCGIWPIQDRVVAFKEALKLSENYIPIGVIAVGYGDETKPFVNRFDKTKIEYIK